MARVVLLLLLLGSVAVLDAKPPLRQAFEIHSELLNALQNATYAKYSLSELFFPRSGENPVCAPISYTLNCDNVDQYNSSFLWTLYDTESFAGKMLISSAYYGFTLWGFNWQHQCSFSDATATDVELEVDFECSNETESVLNTELQALTSALKAYADKINDVTSVSGDTINTYKAYAVPWDFVTPNEYPFHDGLIVLIVLLTLLNSFIFFLSVGTSGTMYKAVFAKIREKRNPYYPLFWSFVVLSIVWNLYPGWVVLTINVGNLNYFIPVIVVIQFFTAFFMRKYLEFPIPGLKWRKHPYTPLIRSSPSSSSSTQKPKLHRHFIWQICDSDRVAHGIFSFIVQTAAIWDLLVFFTFIVYYAVTIAVALYLDPIQTLVKVLFVKAVAMCAVFAVALLFASNSLEWKWNERACLNNSRVVTQFLSALTFLPILAYLAYMIGGVVFVANSSQLSGIQGVLAILPSAFLILVGWMSHGQLFPEKVVESGSVQEVSEDVEEADKDNKDGKNKSPSSQSGPGANGYGTVDVHSGPAGVNTSGSDAKTV